MDLEALLLLKKLIVATAHCLVAYDANSPSASSLSANTKI
jgi:hypothetical protein